MDALSRQSVKRPVAERLSDRHSPGIRDTVASPFAMGSRLRHSGCVEREGPSSDQLEALRRMTPEQRYRASREMYWTLRRHKAAFLRSLHPDWSETDVAAEVRRIFRDART
jgi:hypothetical protein